MYLPWRLIRRFSPVTIDRLAHNFGRRSIDYSADRFISPNIAKQIANYGYDVAVGRYILPTAKSGVLNSSVPTIIDIDDYDPQVYIRRLDDPQLNFFQRSAIRHHTRQLKQLLPHILDKSKHLWVSCEDDISLFPGQHTSILHNIPFDTEELDLAENNSEARANRKPTVLVVGSLGNPANLTGIDWFVKSVWSSVIANIPAAALRIVGSGKRNSLTESWEAVRNVCVVGFSPDLRSEYRNASVVICPVFDGGGTKIKVLEGLKYRKPCVVTSHAVRGYSRLLLHDESLLVADDPTSFSDGVQLLLRHPLKGAELGNNGAKMVHRNFSYQAFSSEVSRTIRSVLRHKFDSYET